MISWIIKKFDALTPDELYAILRLRSEVFVVEQTCVFLDMDNKDQSAYHLMGWQNDILMAYTRLLPPGNILTESSIGRVVTAPAARGNGTGKLLMEKSIEQAETIFGKNPH
ncbi:MAG: GNAT family N-acetyltransferase [Bacteroidota bacterium]